MPRREAKNYVSKVDITTSEGTQTKEISVNHPLTIGTWKIYQVGYDASHVRWSNVSIFECVRDGWYTAIHIALWMVLIAGAWMFIYGWRKPHKRKEVEP